MKKEDFIVGKWYRCSRWDNNIIAVKCSDIGNRFQYSEIVKKQKQKQKHLVATSSSIYTDWENYIEIPISEIQHLLPDNHPDLNPEYVKCVETVNFSYVPGNIINKIYKVKNWNYTFTECILENESHFCKKSRFICATKEEYDKQEYLALGLNFVDDFPKKGCYFDDNDILVNYLIKNNYTQNPNYDKKSKEKQYLKWDSFKYWYIRFESNEFKNYTTQEIHQIINYKTNQNEKNTLQSIETENSRPNHIGTIAIRRGRQQVTTRNRPNGYKTSVKIGRTEINSIKICKNIVQSANY